MYDRQGTRCCSCLIAASLMERVQVGRLAVPTRLFPSDWSSEFPCNLHTHDFSYGELVKAPVFPELLEQLDPLHQARSSSNPDSFAVHLKRQTNNPVSSHHDTSSFLVSVIHHNTVSNMKGSDSAASIRISFLLPNAGVDITFCGFLSVK